MSDDFEADEPVEEPLALKPFYSSLDAWVTD